MSFTFKVSEPVCKLLEAQGCRAYQLEDSRELYEVLTPIFSPWKRIFPRLTQALWLSRSLFPDLSVALLPVVTLLLPLLQGLHHLGLPACLS